MTKVAGKTKDVLIKEPEALRQLVAEFEKPRAKGKLAGETEDEG